MLKNFEQQKSMKNKAFTLAEMLIALVIVGGIAAMSIPSLVGTLQRKIMASQIKNITVSIQQLIEQQLMDYKVKSLCDTDFATPDTLLSSKNFAMSVTCNPASDCVTQDYRKIIDNTIDNRQVPYRTGSIQGHNPSFIRLKNGAILGYAYYGRNGLAAFPESSDGDRVIGIFYIDVNGDDKPNVHGRDYFVFVVTRYGKITNGYEAAGNEYDEDVALDSCLNGTSSQCFAYLQAHNWKMNY